MELRGIQGIKNKRGDVTDILTFGIIVFIMGFGFFILAFIIPEISDGLNEAGLNNTVEGQNAIDVLEDFGTVTIQRGFFLLFIGLAIGTFLSAFLVRTHPIFMFLYIFFLGLTVFIGTYLANAYDQLRNIPLFADELASQTLINLIFENFLVIIIAIGALSMIIIFAKFRSSRGGNPGEVRL